MKEGLTKSAVNELETSDWEDEHRLKASGKSQRKGKESR